MLYAVGQVVNITKLNKQPMKNKCPNGFWFLYFHIPLATAHSIQNSPIPPRIPCSAKIQEMRLRGIVEFVSVSP